jgi:hypothetical protein
VISFLTEEDDLEMPELDINPDIPKLDILNISAETIEKKLDNIKIDKSPEPDNIHPQNFLGLCLTFSAIFISFSLTLFRPILRT